MFLLNNVGNYNEILQIKTNHYQMMYKSLEWKVFLINFRCIVNPFTGFLPSATLFPFSWIISLAHALITGSSLCERKLIDLLYELFGIPLILLSIVSIIGITYSVLWKLFHFIYIQVILVDTMLYMAINSCGAENICYIAYTLLKSIESLQIVNLN